MPIETDFTFAHPLAGSDMAPVAGALAELRPIHPVDLRGRLAGFVGNAPQGKGTKSWKGRGFNLIWRPNFGKRSGPADFFLELNETQEQFDFTDLTGATGIANRGEEQADIFLGGIAYLQQVKDSFDGSGQHFEPGVWVNVPTTSDPAEPAMVARMGSIPHGTTINLQGVSFTAPAPAIAAASITPFTIGSPDDGKTGLVHFAEEDLTKPSPSRTPDARLPGLKPDHLTNPNKFLTDANAGLNFVDTTVIIIASRPGLMPPAAPPVPAHAGIGGGLANIAFLNGGAKPNANVADVTSIFWIETIQHADGRKTLQLQYTQRVLLAFNGLNWPHISCATLTEA